MRAALALVFLWAAPASSHCFSEWRYPWPQNCGAAAPAPKDKSWYVEITQTHPVKDERSPQDIADQKEHDAAVAFHKDEINFLMSVLKAQEQNQ